jgi:hypothetical protein
MKQRERERERERENEKEHKYTGTAVDSECRGSQNKRWAEDAKGKCQKRKKWIILFTWKQVNPDWIIG